MIPQVHELFDLVLEDENIYTNHRAQINDRKGILDQISKQQSLMSRARRFYLNEKIDFEDFGKLKEEHNEMSGYLDSQLKTITNKLLRSSQKRNAWPQENFNIFQAYKNQDIEEKRRIISLFTPSGINPFTKTLRPVRFNKALSLVVDYYDTAD